VILQHLQKPQIHTYEVRLRNDKRGVDLISDALPFGRLWYGEPNAVRNTIAKLRTADFLIKKLPPPHQPGIRGGCSPQNIFGKQDRRQ